MLLFMWDPERLSLDESATFPVPLLTDQTLLWSFDPFAKCTLNAVFFFFLILGTYLKRNLLGGIWELMIAPHMFVQLAI